MAITNRYKGFTEETLGNQQNRLTKHPDFGTNLNRDVTALSSPDATITNSYSSGDTNRFGASTQYSANELRVVQGMVTESIYANGITVRYMPRKSEYTDKVWNESPSSVFDRGLQMDMYLESTAGFEGEGDIMTQYGIEFQEEVILRLSIPRFEELYGKYQDSEPTGEYIRKRPLEGDLIVIPFGISAENKNQYIPKFFEILRVTTYQDGAFFQMGDNYQYKIRARLFELSYENINYDPALTQSNQVGDSEISMDSFIGRINDPEHMVDSDCIVNITRVGDIVDPFASNHEIEVNSQERTLYNANGEALQEKAKVMTKDYTAKAFGYGSVINNLDDI